MSTSSQTESGGTARERLEIMVRTDRGSMTVWSSAEVSDALDGFRAEVLREAARLLEATGRDDDAVNLLDNMASAHEPDGTATSSTRTAGDEQPESAVEFGVRVPYGVMLPTTVREDADAYLGRLRDMYPDAVLVQRTVRYGPWTEVQS